MNYSNKLAFYLQKSFMWYFYFYCHFFIAFKFSLSTDWIISMYLSLCGQVSTLCGTKTVVKYHLRSVKQCV